MKIINYFDTDNQEHWREEIKKCDWVAGAFLYELLSENKHPAFPRFFGFSCFRTRPEERSRSQKRREPAGKKRVYLLCSGFRSFW